MSMQDPLSDLFTRIRNGQMAKKSTVSIPASTIKLAVLNVLAEEGYINHFSVDNEVKRSIMIELKYFAGKPVIDFIRRCSKPSLRIYKSKDNLPKVLGGLGIAIVSTSKGVMTDRSARRHGLGGEVICLVA